MYFYLMGNKDIYYYYYYYYYYLNKREFRDAIKLRYDWEIADLPAMCTCGDLFTVDHAMVCRHGGADHSEAQ